MATHLGQNVKDHVVLINRLKKGETACGTLSFKDQALFRVQPDGSVDSGVFKVPKGQVLVVTDVEWSAYGGQQGTIPLEPNRTLRFGIHVGNQPEPDENPIVFVSSLKIDAAEAKGRPGKSEYMTAGFMVSAGKRICPNASQTDVLTSATAFVDRLILRGYLTAAN